MNKVIAAQGVKQFAENTNAKISCQDDVLFQVKFPGEPYPTLIGIEYLGLLMSYSTVCGILPDTELAPTLLRRNWGGVESTCFYFSVFIEDGEPWFTLETRQFIDPNANSEDIASILGMWRLQCLHAKESLKH